MAQVARLHVIGTIGKAARETRPLLATDFSREAEACLFDCVQTLIQAGRAADALALVDETRTPARRSARLHAAIALAQVHLGNFGQARKSLEKADGSGEPARLHARALVAAKEGDLAGAREAAAQAKAERYTELGALRADLAAARKAKLTAAGTRSRGAGRGRSR